MEIINIVELVNGVVISIHSFTCKLEDSESVSKEAEKLMLKLARENGYKGDSESIIKNGNWNNNEYEITSLWSHTVANR